MTAAAKAAIAKSIADLLGIDSSFVTVAYVESVFGSRRLGGAAAEQRRVASTIVGSKIVFSVDQASALQSSFIAATAGLPVSSLSSDDVSVAIGSILTTAASSGTMFTGISDGIAASLGFSSAAALSTSVLSADSSAALVLPVRNAAVSSSSTFAPPVPLAGNAFGVSATSPAAPSPIGAVIGGVIGGLVAVAIAAAVVVRLRRRAADISAVSTVVVRSVDTLSKEATAVTDSAGDPQEITSSPVSKYDDFTHFEMQEATIRELTVPLPPLAATRPSSLKNPFATLLSSRTPSLSSRRDQVPSSLPPAPKPAQRGPTTLDDFIAAAERGDDKFIATALAASPFLARAVRADGIAAAHVAARAGNAATLTLLLDNGSDVTAADVRGLTILHHAVLSKSVQASRAALARGAPLEARDSAGKTPREVAVLIKAADVAELLSEAARELVASASASVLASASVEKVAPLTPTGSPVVQIQTTSASHKP